MPEEPGSDPHCAAAYAASDAAAKARGKEEGYEVGEGEQSMGGGQCGLYVVRWAEIQRLREGEGRATRCEAEKGEGRERGNGGACSLKKRKRGCMRLGKE